MDHIRRSYLSPPVAGADTLVDGPSEETGLTPETRAEPVAAEAAKTEEQTNTDQPMAGANKSLTGDRDTSGETRTEAEAVSLRRSTKQRKPPNRLC